jgi:predicted phosphodiesterase
MRVLLTADLHYNNPKSRRLADELINEMKGVAADVLLLVGDTATSEGDDLEKCLSRFDGFGGVKLFVAGNHELWTRGEDSYRLWKEELPRRVRGVGWRWLEAEPFVRGDWGIVGSVGWYDYSFACEELGMPRRFYEKKVSPGAARMLGMGELLERDDDVPQAARDVYARWNDGKFVKLGRPDEAFAEELARRLEEQLASLSGVGNVLVAMHHLPFREMLPPPHTAQWDFVKAFLGAERLGRVIHGHGNVKTVVCGHTHLPMEGEVGGIRAINVGSGYRIKRYRLLELG